LPASVETAPLSVTLRSVVERFSHEQVAVTVHCDAARVLEASMTFLAVFAACLRPVTCQERLHAAPSNGKEGQFGAHKLGAVGKHSHAADVVTRGNKLERGELRVEASAQSSW